MWQATDSNVWQGRDDSRESPEALRVFQTVRQHESWPPALGKDDIALIGFASDAGVGRNRGRIGAAEAPPVLRRALANLAHHPAAFVLHDAGDFSYADQQLESGQQELAAAVKRLQEAGARTLVLGGGHETAFAHGKGLFDAHPGRHIAIINFDPHLDLRRALHATSGTPFAQLAALAAEQGRKFDYTCIGASRAANTAALLQDAAALDVDIVWDTDVHWLHAAEQGRKFDYTCIGASRAANTAALLQDAAALDVDIVWDTDVHWLHAAEVAEKLRQKCAQADAVYLTIDLDVLSAAQMPAVSAPAALGIPLDLLLYLIRPVLASGKTIAADAVEYSPPYERDNTGARSAARLLWQIWQDWR